MTTAHNLDERRKHSRCSTVPATATVLSGGRLVAFEVENISASGALLRGSEPIAVGTRVRLSLTIAGKWRAGMWAVAVRVQSMPPGWSTALEFRGLSAGLEDRLHDMIVAALSAAVPSRADQST